MKEQETTNQGEMAEAISNFELFWAHKPLNSERVYQHMPLATEADLQERMDAVRQEIAAIARNQQDGWGGEEI